MKKKKITYGVYGMMEYLALIKIGKSTLKVLFTDGSMTSMGENPARYTTDNFMFQHAIELSDEFKRGLIKVVSEIELDEELRIESNEGNTSQHLSPAETPQTKFPEDDQKNEVESTETSSASSSASEETEEIPKKDSTKTAVEFTCNDDAKDYLERTFGVKRSTLRTRADIVSIGERNGVSIHFISE